MPLTPLFRHSPIPQAVLAAADDRVVDVNDAMLELVGRDRQAFEATPLADWLQGYAAPGDKRGEVCLPDGSRFPVEVEEATFDSDGVPVRLLTLTDLRRLARLEESIRKERESVRSYLRTNVRVMQLTQRIMQFPAFMEFMEAYSEDQYLYQGVCDFMTHAHNMEFAASAIYRQHRDEDSTLQLQHAIGFAYPETLDLADENGICRVARGDQAIYEDDEGNLCVPLPIAGEVDGALVVQYHDVTHRLVQEDSLLKSSMHDLVKGIGKVLGTRLQNLALVRKIRQQTITDPLTGLYNRRFFDQRLEEETLRARRHGHDLSLVMIDLDKFKQVNDTLGHQQGDSLLIEFADLMKNSVRRSDFPCRMGGDEFALILPETPHWAGAFKAEKLCKMIDGYKFRNVIAGSDVPIHVTLSVGVAGLFDDMANTDAFYQEADDVLYMSKEGGRNRVTIARPDIAAEGARHAILRSRRRRERETAEVAYEPGADSASVTSTEVETGGLPSTSGETMTLRNPGGRPLESDSGDRVVSRTGGETSSQTSRLPERDDDPADPARP